MQYLIKERREQEKMSQEELAKRTGISRVTISRLESGMQRRPYERFRSSRESYNCYTSWT